jgi:hypothetical protein
MGISLLSMALRTTFSLPAKPRIPRRNILIEPSGGCRATIGSSCVFQSQPLNHAGASWKKNFDI